MPRTPVWAVYVDDIGRSWALLVDGDYFLQPERGWLAAEGFNLAPLPRTYRARRVVGLDETGRKRFATVATVGAELWTGVEPTFIFETRDGGQALATVIELQAERRFGSQPA